jgi:two-component system NtrC family sensor kinase
MRLMPKLTLGILVASAVPLVIAGFTSARLSEAALRARTQEGHAALAVNAADGVSRFFDGIAALLEVCPRMKDLEGSPPELVTGVLRVAYHSDEDIRIVSLLDEHGLERVGSAYLSSPADAAKLHRAAVSDAERDEFLTRVPVAEALVHGRAVGPVVMIGHPATPRAAVAIVFAGKNARYVLAADVSLARLHQRLAALSQGGNEVLLVDQERRAVAGGNGARPLGEAVTLPDDRDPAGPLPQKTSVATVDPPGRAPALAAFAPAGASGLGVLVWQPVAVAFAHTRDLRARTIYWLLIAVLVAIVVGVGLAREVARRVTGLVEGTRKLAQGDFETRLEATGDDEISQLGRAFNRTASDLGTASDAIRRRNAEISAKNLEILKWNQELTARVEAKTAELRKAEELLLRSRSMAAVGTLGAGMAHEINNPLTGILGAAQLMLLDLPPGTPQQLMVKDLERQAQRIRVIVENLLRLSEREAGSSQAAVDLNRVVQDSLALVPGSELERARIHIECQLTEPLPPLRGDAVQLQDALLELMTNARRAMPEGGTLTLATSAPDKRFVALRVSDTGPGIAAEIIDKIFDPFFTTKTHWQSTGMGLTMVHKIVEDHRGTIAVESPAGKGASFTLRFPVAGAAHLE